MNEYNCVRCGVNKTDKNSKNGRCDYCGGRFATGVVTDGSKDFTTNQIVVLKDDIKNWNGYFPGYKFLYLGRVLQKPEFCVIVDVTGRIRWNVPIEYFRAPVEGELNVF